MVLAIDILSNICYNIYNMRWVGQVLPFFAENVLLSFLCGGVDYFYGGFMMKKTRLYFKALSVLFSFLMCFSCFTGFSVAAGTPTLSVVGGDVEAGGEITVSVNMSNNPGIAGMNAYVTYDSSVLTPTAVSQGNAIAGVTFMSNLNASNFDASDELIAITMFAAGNAVKNGTFFTITFKANEGASDVSSLITLSCSDATNQDLDEVTVNTSVGFVNVLAEGEKDDGKDDEKEDNTKGEIKLRAKASKIKYMTGRSSTKFEPDENATRYEVLECFYNLFDVDVMAVDNGLKDVAPKYKSMVNLFATAGVIKGYDDDGDGTPEVFKGNNTITRAEFCVFIVNLMGLSIKNVENQGFPDVKGSNWYVPYVNAVAKAGYVKGRDTGLFDPNGLITRSEVATLINRITKVDVDVATTCIYDDVSPNRWYFKQVAAAAKAYSN